MRSDEVLDDPAWSALTGPHQRFAVRHGDAVRYCRDVSAFGALADPDDPGAWADLTEIAEGDPVALVGLDPDRPAAGWRVVRHLPALQLVETGALRTSGMRDAELVALGPDGVPQMLDLVERTRPGPFLTRTAELAGYVGFRSDGALVAMGGRRMAPPGWREVSAICTDPAHRGRGHGRRIIDAVVGGVRREGDAAFLHVTVGNPAVHLYEALGFTVRRRIDIVVVQQDLASG